MEQLFRDLYHDSQRHGRRAVFGLWMRTILDFSVTVVQQHLLARGRRAAGDIDMSTFESQLNNNIQRWIDSLREGYSVWQCIEKLAEEGAGPTSAEFKQVLSDIQGGMSLLDALRALQTRVNSARFNEVMAAMEQQMQEGGNLADRLEAVLEEKS